MTGASVIALALTCAMTAAASAEANTYAIDPAHTSVTFEVPHLAISTSRGRFDRKEGTVQIDRAAKAGKVEMTIDTTSINTGTPAFDQLLQGKDVFNAAEFPSARFVADKFAFKGDKVAEVAGTLTLLGKTQPLVLKASNFNCYTNPLLKREVCGGDFEATLVRSEFGMSWGLNLGYADRVRILVQIEAIKQ